MDWVSEGARMKMTGKIRNLFSGAIMTATLIGAASAQQPPAHRWAIVVHGGAGIIERASMNPTTEAAYRASLAQATRPARRFSIVAARRWMPSRPQFVSSKTTRSSMPVVAQILRQTAGTSLTRPSWTAQT